VLKFILKSLLLCLILLGSSAFGQDAYLKYALDALDSAKLAKHTQYLSSNELQGREAGYTGQKLAAAYIAQSFQDCGMLPLKGKQFQKFRLDQFDQTQTLLIREKDTLRGGFDFLTSGYFRNSTLQSKEVVYLSYGIDEAEYSNYKGVEVKDKWIIIKDGIPELDSTLQKSSLLKAASLDSKIETALKHGVFGIILLKESTEFYLKEYEHYFQSPRQFLPSDSNIRALPVIKMTANTCTRFFSDFDQRQWNKIDQKFKQGNYKFKEKYISTMNYINGGLDTTISTENVLGFIPSDSSNAKTLILTAHYDHLGVKHDKIYNGADDNASGTAALISIGNALMSAYHKGWRPKRNILIMPVSAEEKGLIGSRYYTRNPIIPLDSIVACLNVDMIGRVDTTHAENPHYIYVIGSDFISNRLHEINEEVNENGVLLSLDYTYNSKSDPNQFYYRSDHYNFAKNGIPSIFFFSGVHEDYHKHTDTFEKLDIQKMTLITEHILRLVWKLSNETQEL
jgi:hypothetical protein